MSRFITPRSTAVDGNGAPIAGAKLYFYLTATTTPEATYSDMALAVPNTNPVVADANGVFGPIFLSSATYKVVLKDAVDVTIWTEDPVSGFMAADVLLAFELLDATIIKEADIGTGLVVTAGTVTVDVGTTANKVVALDGTAKLPAVDGSQLTNIPGGKLVQRAITVDTTEMSTTSGTLVDTGISVALTGVVSGNVIRFTAIGVAGVANSGVRPIFALYRGTTSLVPTGATEHTTTLGQSHGAQSWSAIAEDTGHGGGSLTYRLYWRSGSGGTVWLGRANDATANIQAPTTLLIEEITP